MQEASRSGSIVGSKTPPICQVELLNVLFDQTLSNLSGIAESAKKTKKVTKAAEAPKEGAQADEGSVTSSSSAKKGTPSRRRRRAGEGKLGVEHKARPSARPWRCY